MRVFGNRVEARGCGKCITRRFTYLILKVGRIFSMHEGDKYACNITLPEFEVK